MLSLPGEPLPGTFEYLAKYSLTVDIVAITNDQAIKSLIHFYEITMNPGEPNESITNGQTRHVQPPASAALRAKQQRPKKGW